MRNQEGVTRTLVVIAILVVVAILGNLFYFIFWQNNQDDKESVVVFDEDLYTDIEKIEDRIIEVKHPDFDYKDADSLSSIVPCYLNDNPQDMIYFPEGILRAFFDNISSDSKTKDLGCEAYNYKEIDDYVAALFQTDVDNDGLNLYLENIYYTDDNKEDTDDDSYSDFMEINNGYNPNDANSGPRGLDIFDYGDEELTDVPGDENNDPNGDDGDNGDDDGGVGDDLPQEPQINQPEDCLGLPEGEINSCLYDFVEIMSSLEPCMLSADFNRCVADINIFWHISSSDECYEYKDFMNITNFDKCLSMRSMVESDVNICFLLQEAQPLECINNLVDVNENLNLCAYVYFLQSSLNSNDAWQYHKTCINHVYTSEPEVEEWASSGCENIDSADSNINELYKILCFINLAVAYDDIDYCNDAAMLSGSMNQAVMNECINKLSQ